MRGCARPPPPVAGCAQRAEGELRRREEALLERAAENRRLERRLRDSQAQLAKFGKVSFSRRLLSVCVFRARPFV